MQNIQTTFNGKPVADHLVFLQDIPTSAEMGWTQPHFPRSTYLELVGSGKMGLIKSIQLRELINDYYEELEEWHKRGSTRVNSNFANIIFSIVPYNHDVEKDVNMLDLNLADEDIGALVEALLDSGLKALFRYAFLGDIRKTNRSNNFTLYLAI